MQYLVLADGYAGVSSLMALVAVVAPDVADVSVFVDAYLVNVSYADTLALETGCGLLAGLPV